MADELIQEIKDGASNVSSLSGGAVSEIDQILNELTKIAKRDHLSSKPNVTGRRKKVENQLNNLLIKLGA